MITFITAVRAVLMIPVWLAGTVVFSLSTVLFGTLGYAPGANFSIRLWSLLALWLFGVKLEVRGAQNIPVQEGVLYVFNHQSYYDIFALCGYFKQTVRFGAKIELFKIPILGWAMRKCGTLPIARGNRAEVLQVYREATHRFKSGESFILAPEGTRQLKPEIGDFKRGPFLFAVEAQVRIVPVVISGAHEVLSKEVFLPNYGKLRRTIVMEFLPPVSTLGMGPDQVTALGQYVREEMTATYSALRASDAGVKG